MSQAPRPDSPLPSDQEPTGVVFRWTEHAGLLVGVGGFTLVALRVLAVSNYNTTTARAIVEAGGAANVALGSALASVQTLGVFFLTSLAIIAGRRVYYGQRVLPRSWYAVGAVWCLYLAVFVVPVASLLLAVLIVPGAWALRRLRPPAGHFVPWRRDPGMIAYLIGGFLLPQIVAISGQPWLPPERFERDGEPPFTGYVVGERDGSLIILAPPQSDAPLPLGEYPAGGLAREYCDVASGGVWFETLLSLFGPSPGYPACPSRGPTLSGA
jgi:hypothetical protein